MCLKFIYYHTFIQLIDGRINKCVTNHFCCIYRLEICVLLANISQSKSQTKCFSASIIASLPVTIRILVISYTSRAPCSLMYGMKK